MILQSPPDVLAKFATNITKLHTGTATRKYQDMELQASDQARRAAAENARSLGLKNAEWE